MQAVRGNRLIAFVIGSSKRIWQFKNAYLRCLICFSLSAALVSSTNRLFYKHGMLVLIYSAYLCLIFDPKRVDEPMFSLIAVERVWNYWPLTELILWPFSSADTVWWYSKEDIPFISATTWTFCVVSGALSQVDTNQLPMQLPIKVGKLLAKESKPARKGYRGLAGFILVENPIIPHYRVFHTVEIICIMQKRVHSSCLYAVFQLLY